MAEQKKIVVFDCCRFKFMRPLMAHWESLGHIVKYHIYWDPMQVEWADIVFFEWVDNSLIRASNPQDAFYNNGLFGPQPQNKKIIARCHDIDAWCEHFKRVNWDWVNDLVFVADHIEKMVKSKIDFPATLKIHNIRHGIDLDRFTFRNKEKGNKIAWVGRITHHKCLELALQVLAENPSYELHAVGTSLDSWEEAYVYDFVKRNNLKFFYTPEVPPENMNQWLEDKDFSLLTSFKEAFSFVSAEAMAKGIKPLIHHFYGAGNVWDKKYLWNRVSEVKSMLEGEYNPVEYRNFIQANYNLERMFLEYDNILFK